MRTPTVLVSADMRMVCPACNEPAPASASLGDTCERDGWVFLEPDQLHAVESDPTLGRVISGRYAVYRRVAQGGMGNVYRARHAFLMRDVAIKTIRPEFLEASKDARARFQREAVLLARLRSAHIVPLLDFAPGHSGWFLVMDWIEGVDLSERLKAAPDGLPPDVAITIADGLLRALELAHESGLVHRDVKPANIRLRPTGRGLEAVLMDFGLARPLLDSMLETTSNAGLYQTRRHVIAGTRSYLSPERLAGQPASPASDVYAAGLVIRQMLEGTPSQRRTLDLSGPSGRPDLDRIAQAGLPHTARVVQRMLATSPTERPASAMAARGLLVNAFAADQRRVVPALAAPREDIGDMPRGPHDGRRAKAGQTGSRLRCLLSWLLRRFRRVDRLPAAACGKDRNMTPRQGEASVRAPYGVCERKMSA